MENELYFVDLSATEKCTLFTSVFAFRGKSVSVRFPLLYFSICNRSLFVAENGKKVITYALVNSNFTLATINR